MPKLNINNGGVDTNKKMPDIDERFGPYTSIEAADAALGGQGRNTITAGLTVGILTANTGVKEYWYQPNKKTGQLELIPKGGNAADNPTEGNFASFDANGNVVDSKCNEGTFIKGVQKNGTNLTPDSDGKVNVEVQDGKSAYELYVDEYKEAHSGSTEGMLDEDEWLDSLDAYGVYVKQYDELNPQDPGHQDPDFMSRGQWLEYIKGKSAREIYEKEYNKQLTDAEFAAELKMNYPMLHVGYNASNAGASVGVPFTGNLNPSGENIGASESTMGKLYLMPDDDSDPENCICFVTVLDGSTYKWCNVGAIRIPSDVLAKSDVDNKCVDGATDKPASAKAVMDLKVKLEGVTVREIKVPLVTSGPGQNVFNGQVYTKGANPPTTTTNSSYRYIVINVEGYKSVRFLGRLHNVSTIDSGWAFYDETNYDEEATTGADNGFLKDNTGYISGGYQTYDFDTTLPNSGTKEYIVKVPNGAKYLKTCVKIGGVTLENFYCYLQSGESVVEIIDSVSKEKDAEIDELRKEVYEYVPIIANKTQSNVILNDNYYGQFKYNGYYSCRIYELDGIEGDIYLYISSKLISSNQIVAIAWASDEQTEWPANASGNYEKDINGFLGWEYPYKDAPYNHVKLTIPSNAKFLYLCKSNSYSGTCEIERPISKIGRIDEDVVGIQADVEEINKELYDYKEIKPNDTHHNAYYNTSNHGKFKTVQNYDVEIYNLTGLDKDNLFFYAPTRSTPQDEYMYIVWASALQENWAETNGETEDITGFIKSEYPMTADGYNYQKLTPPPGAQYLYICHSTSYTTVKLYKTDEDSRIDYLEDYIKTNKSLNILAIGNSNSQDSLAYVPYLLKKIAPDIDVTFGILYLGSASLIHHLHNFDYAINPYNDNPSGSHYETDTGVITNTDWVTMYNNGNSYDYYYWFLSTSENWGKSSQKRNIQYVLGLRKWDIILFNGTSFSKVMMPLIQRIMNYIQTKQEDNTVLPYKTKFGLINPAISVVYSNGISNFNFSTDLNGSKGKPYDEGSIDSEDATTLFGKWKNQLAGAETILNKTLCEFVIPIDAAICNALTVEEFKKMGDLALHVNNQNYINGSNTDDGCYGYLRAPDGVHLQEGLPCQIAAYTTICKIFELLGRDYKSIIGDNTICDSDWLLDKASSIPGPNPNEKSGPTQSNAKKYTIKDVLAKQTTGWSDDQEHGDEINKERVLFAQKCAVMAIKHPFEITDMKDHYGVKYPICFYGKNVSRDNTQSIIEAGSEYKVEINANSGTISTSNVNVKMGGNDITNNEGVCTQTTPTTVTINISEVTGEVQISAVI